MLLEQAVRSARNERELASRIRVTAAPLVSRDADFPTKDFQRHDPIATTILAKLKGRSG
jgi:hypothetical protein